MIKIDARGGETIEGFCRRAIAVAKAADEEVEARHNGTSFIVYQEHAKQAYAAWLRERDNSEEE